MNPHQVCQSSAINFSRFADVIEKKYNEDRDSINEEFFKQCVDSVIIFDSLDLLISKAEWYPKGGNKAQIIPYAIAKLFTMIPKGKDIDWKIIWNKQSMYPELAEELMDIAYEAHMYLLDVAGGGIVRTISRTQNTWNGFKDKKMSLSEPFLHTLISIEETQVEAAAAKRAHKFDSEIDASVEIFKLGADYWMNVYNALAKGSYLAYGDLDFIRNIATMIQKFHLPTSAQCKRLVKVVEKAEDKGYIMP